MATKFHKAKSRTTTMQKQIFVNLPVKDLKKSMKFFAKLGYSFNPQFTDEKAACMIIDENIFAMLVTKNFFKNFTKKRVSDATKSTESIVALSAESRTRVDEMVKLAKRAGGTVPNKSQDHGWMYGHGFQDLDGHLWEILYMDEGKLKEMT